MVSESPSLPNMVTSGSKKTRWRQPKFTLEASKKHSTNYVQYSYRIHCSSADCFHGSRAETRTQTSPDLQVKYLKPSAAGLCVCHLLPSGCDFTHGSHTALFTNMFVTWPIKHSPDMKHQTTTDLVFMGLPTA